MKRFYIAFLVFLLMSFDAKAQKVHSVEYPNQADVKVFVVDYENQANIVTEESLQTGNSILHKDYNIYFKTDILKNCIELEELIDKHYNEKLNKYNTLSPEEQENQIPFDDDYQNTSSLKYHLEKRGII